MPASKQARIACFIRQLWVMTISFGFLCLSATVPGQPIGYTEAQVAFSPDGGNLDMILSALRSARKKVDVAMAFLSHEDLILALCMVAQRPDVTVRFLTDSEMAKPAQLPIWEKMALAGIETHVISVRSGKMHLKMMVIDDDLVVSGTANWTRQAFDANIEDTVVLRSSGLARKYREEFDRLLSSATPIAAYHDEATSSTKKQFQHSRWPSPPHDGSKKVLTVPRPRAFRTVGKPNWMQKDTESLEAWFTSDTGVVEALEGSIRSATNRIDVEMYLLNQPQLVAAICEQGRNPQVHVRLLFDVQMLETGFVALLDGFAQAGCEVAVYGGERNSLHLKTLIVDGHDVWTGSANWTKAAMTMNIEDILCFHSESVAAHYRALLDQIAFLARPHAAPELVVSADSADARVQLPPTGPRLDYSHLAQPPFESFECNAQVRYLADGEYLPVLLDTIRGTEQSLLMLMYTFPFPESEGNAQNALVKELKRAAARGVYVHLCLYTPPGGKDRLGDMHSDWAERLRAEGIDVRLSTPDGAQHDKLVVSDCRRVLVGSHNWSEGALTGTRVYESSVLLELPQPDSRWADYVLGRQKIADMRSRKHWETEIECLRRLGSLSGRKKAEQAASLENVSHAGARASFDWANVRDAILEGHGGRIVLRDGRVLSGKCIGSQTARYQWQSDDGQIQWMNKEDVLLIRADMGVPHAPFDNAMSRLAKTVFLPQGAFGENLVEGVSQAKDSILVTSYNMSAGLYGPLGDFYAALKQKAQEGVEVVLITEFGPGTSAFLKRSVLNFASTLLADGIHVRFMQGHKVLHKKMVVVDGRTLWLGSANLTTAGLSLSSESNICVHDGAVAKAAETDFRKLFTEAKTMSDLKY